MTSRMLVSWNIMRLLDFGRDAQFSLTYGRMYLDVSFTTNTYHDFVAIIRLRSPRPRDLSVESM
jgi:hypothetical protein